MDNKALIEGMKKLKSAIEDFIDNMEMDGAEKGMKKKAPKAKPEDEDEKDGE
jgi:hypothetical protein